LNTQAHEPPNATEERRIISLIEIFTVIGVNKMLIGKTMLAVLVLSVLFIFSLTPIYTAKTVFIVPNPIQAGGSFAQSMGNLGGLMGAGGASSLLGMGKSPDEMYLEFLRTKFIQDRIISKLGLQQKYNKKSLEQTEKKLKARTKFTNIPKAGLISIEIDDEDPIFAAEIANVYVSELKEMMGELALSESSQRKEYYKRELIRAKNELDGVTDYREMKIRESVLAVIANQLEVATLDTARESIIQVAEIATAPETKSFPKRIFLTMIMLAIGLVSVIFYVFIKKNIFKYKNEGSMEILWHKLKKSWRFKAH
jgi:capsular polysaccharide biosynthesis protein